MRKLIAVSLLFACLAVFAEDDIPLRNWAVPSVGKVATNTNGTSFIGITPCRILDTRNAAGPFGGPMLGINETRTFDVAASPCPEVAAAAAYSMNFTIVSYNPAASGYLTAFPDGSPRPVVATLNFGSGPPVNNAIIVTSGPGARINVYSSASTHLIIDVNGYFIGAAGILPSPKLFSQTGDVPNNGVVVGRNTTNVSGAFTSGILGVAMDTTLVDGSGVMGHALGGVTWGVKGVNTGSSINSGGVLGFAVARPTSTEPHLVAGVRGESTVGFGVLGQTSGSVGAGAAATYLDAQGNIVRGAYLATHNGYAMYASGNTGASGTKSFVDPHPTDPTKVVRFVSLEGPEAGTYFRGRGRFARGKAVIDVPEAFRITTEEEGLTVHITPMGQPAMVAVTRQSLAGIEATATRDVEFSYVVYGVRRGYKDFQPIDDGTEFVPDSASAKLPAYLNDSQKQRLIENGTYHADGTVNLSTAVRLGWEKGWAERERQR